MLDRLTDPCARLIAGHPLTALLVATGTGMFLGIAALIVVCVPSKPPGPWR